MGVRTPSAFIINPPFLSPKLVIFSSNMLSLIKEIWSKADPKSFVACEKNIFFNGCSDVITIRIGPTHFFCRISP